ncbi:MAG: AAA family ATPase [Muribaculaceae bacterium]|nr:AAA family ATPase [Muribaculaceae bacterium]
MVKDYPIGILTFRAIREEGKLYVDKTGYVHQLVSKGKYYLPARMRHAKTGITLKFYPMSNF